MTTDFLKLTVITLKVESEVFNMNIFFSIEKMKNNLNCTNVECIQKELLQN